MIAAISKITGAIFGLLLIIGGLIIYSTKTGIGGALIALAGLIILPRILPKVSEMFGGRAWPAWLACALLALVAGPMMMGEDKPKPSLADKYVAQGLAQEQKAANQCNGTTTAFVMSQGFVKDALKSPSSAKFPMITDGVKVSKTGKCSFNVLGYVDAQNGFGAMARQDYAVDIEYLPTSDSWKLLNITMQ